MKSISKFLKPFAQTLLLGLVLVGSGPSFPQNLEKNDMPCVKEICLGDGMQELQKINWEKAREFPRAFSSASGDFIASRRTSSSELAEMLKNYKGPASVIRAVSAYLPADYRSGHFDSTSLPLLSKMEAGCRPYPLEGRYTPQGGFPTAVAIGLFASADGSSQSWKVFEINRYFPQNLTAAQLSQINGQVETSYQKWLDGKRHVYITLASQSFAGSNVYFQMSSTGNPNLALYRDESMRHPLCGGTQKLQIN
ncbi:hypothetical protein [Polaromonas sp.]|uniref:hypothetical protein n=1 Tax=Polaromonas sp. TaxID=1869339 RepID=UPI0032671F62